MDATLLLASGEASFFDETFLYISGGLLILFALVVSFLGMKKEDFPTETQFRAMSGIAVILVICTSIGAVQSARFEQAERREKNQEAAKEAEAEKETKEEDLAPLTEGEAAEPGTEDEESPAQEEATGDADASADGKALFVDSGCGDCHVLADAGTDGAIGPSLDDVLPGQDADAIRTSIVDPGASITDGFPEGVMPANYGEQFTEVEIDTLVAYLVEVAGK